MRFPPPKSAGAAAGGQVRLAGALQEPVRAALERAGLLGLFGAREGREIVARLAS